MYSLTDCSLYLSIEWEFNAKENLYLSAGIQSGAGDGPALLISDNPDSLILNSEFGSYPDMVYMSLRFYF